MGIMSRLFTPKKDEESYTPENVKKARSDAEKFARRQSYETTLKKAKEYRRSQGFLAKITGGARKYGRQLDTAEKESIAGRVMARTSKTSGYIRRTKQIYTGPGGIRYSVRKTPTGKGGRVPGRPKQSFKARINPFTGQMVRMPALPYYKLIRSYNRMLQGRAAGSMQAQQAALARRGVPPSVAAQILAQRQAQAMQQVQPQQMPQEQAVPLAATSQPMPQYPQQVPRQPERFMRVPDRYSQHIDAFRRNRPQIPFTNKNLVMQNGQLFKVETDIMSGRKRLIPARQMLY